MDALGGSYPAPEVDGVLYAVGDLHGRVDLLEAMAARLLEDALSETRPEEPPHLVFVGDVIDRGPDSRGVVEFLRIVQQWPEFRTSFIVGNHELMLLKFLESPQKARSWLRHGGYETMLSYGLDKLGDIEDRANLEELAAGLAAAMGPHRAFLEAMVPSVQLGNVLVTHAGADPALPAAAQTPRTLAWGSPDFLKKRRRDGVWVVYGHNIVPEPVARAGRIAIDTGAYATGRLTAVRIAGQKMDFISVTGAEGDPDAD